MLTVVTYFRKIPEGKVTEGIAGLVFSLLLGCGLGVAAIAWHVRGPSVGVGASIAVIAPTAMSLMLASMLLFFISQRKTPVGDLKVAVGDPLLAFTATTADGKPFHSDEFAGKRILLKFFRGGW